MEEIKFENIKKDIKLSGKKENLFQKIEVEKPKENQKQKIENELKFSDLNLKVGKIIEVQKVENSKKLYKIIVDLKDEKRQIVSGLQGFYEIEDLLNRNIIVLCNLKKAKLAGEISEGMLLAVDNPNNKNDCGLLTTKNLLIGENLFLINSLEIANSQKEIKFDKFLKYKMIAKEEGIFFEKEKISKIYVHKNFLGRVC